MIIEFAGVSGSGKSILMLALRRILRRRGLAVGRLRPPPELASKLVATAAHSFDLAHPGLSTAFEAVNEDLPSAIHARSFAANRLGFNSIRDDFSLLQMKPEPNRIVLLDEGFLHRLAYMAALNRSESKFPELVAAAPKPDVLVLMTIDQSVAEQRIVNRGPVETAYKRQRTYDALVHAHATTAELLLQGSAVFANHGVKVHVIDGTKPTRRTAKSIANTIELPRGASAE